MSKYLDMSLTKINSLLKLGEIKPIDLVMECFSRIEQSDLNAFITLNKEDAIKQAIELENKEVDNILFGIPIAIKDIILTKNLRTTCASKMLENFVPIIDATVIEKIKEKNMIIVGKTNMDEFAMGSTSRTSYFGAPLNPWNKSRVTGGSSGGSAAAVSARILPFALGSDTGGSIRQPASYCGIVGMKPTYGRVSRYGVVAFGSSFDQVGPMTRTVYENAAILNILCGHDDKDLTSSDRKSEDFTSMIGQDIKYMKIGIPKYFMSDIVSLPVRSKVLEIVEWLKAEGATVDYIDVDYIENSVTLYQILAMGEASSNLAKFDGIRYGYSCDNPDSLDDLYMRSRQFGFGNEVKRRIMIGSYLLSGDNAKIYYDKAMKIRDDMRKSFLKAYESYDLIIGPVATTVAYDAYESLDDPLKTFYDDVLVYPANLAGLPGMSIPIGFDEQNMPIGLQILGAPFDEAKMYKLATYIENAFALNLDPREVK